MSAATTARAERLARERASTGPVVANAQLRLMPDPTRVVIRPFVPVDPDSESYRADRISQRVFALSPADLKEELHRTMTSLASRHRDIGEMLSRRFDEINGPIISRCAASADQARLIGAYFSEEYSFEACAVLNPSIVAHPDQATETSRDLRFILSLRGVGEGEVSSITFRSGTWHADGNVTLEPASRTALSPRIEMRPGPTAESPDVRLHCDAGRDLSEIVIFPVTASQRHGIEDLRLVRFVEESGEVTYLGTYVAFSGTGIRQEMLKTSDFRTFDLSALRGDAAANKGLALFPRKIAGRYAALSRKDHENIWFVQSDDLHDWKDGTLALAPRWPWEFVQIGTCGPPIELDEGWLVITHGVGSVRNYCLGACLLDKADPSRVLARSASPFLRPSGAQRDGFVPNVIYSCGALLRGRMLLLPYAVADNFTAFATVDVDRLIQEMV